MRCGSAKIMHICPEPPRMDDSEGKCKIVRMVQGFLIRIMRTIRSAVRVG